MCHLLTEAIVVEMIAVAETMIVVTMTGTVVGFGHLISVGLGCSEMFDSIASNAECLPPHPSSG